jgi:hypothetical protein
MSVLARREAAAIAVTAAWALAAAPGRCQCGDLR